MQVVLNPACLMQMQEFQNHPQRAQEVYLRTVSLLKNVINTDWNDETEGLGQEDDQNKENSNQLNINSY